MSKKFQILLCFLSCTLFLSSLNAQQKISDDNRKLSIEERMIRLEEGQKSLEKRFDDLTLQMNNRFTDMNNQFDDINSKFNWLYIMLSSIIALRHYDLINHREAELEKQVRRLSEEVELIKSQIEITS